MKYVFKFKSKHISFYFYIIGKYSILSYRVAPKEVIYFIFSISPSMLTGIPPRSAGCPDYITKIKYITSLEANNLTHSVAKPLLFYYRKVLFFNKKERKNKRHNKYASKI